MSAQPNVIPSFFLYGEAPRRIDDRFLHVEDLDHRSRPSNWNIRAHAHRDLHHLFHFVSGGGSALVDDAPFVLTAPCLLVVPAGRVHGFAFEPETNGSVLTVADGFLRELTLREKAFAGLFVAASRLELSGRPEGIRIADCLTHLARELVWTAPAHASAVEADLLTILVGVLRLSHQQRPAERPPWGPQGELVARFRELIERFFRTETPLETYAEALGVTTGSLRTACARIAGAPPSRLIQERILLEAKRLLLYTNMGVAEIAYTLGFEDPAYFSRFFAEKSGTSPRAFRGRDRVS